MPPSRAKRASVAERRGKAIAMRLAGVPLDTIADRLGYSGRAAVSKDIARALEQYQREVNTNVAELIAVELGRLDRLSAGHWAKATQGDPRAAEVILKCMAHRAKLLGLEAPTRVETAVNPSPEIAEMIAEAHALADAEDPE